MLKVWNLCLVIASFALSIFGTFEVRSGIISSVHSFAYSNIGTYYLVFLVIIIVFSMGLFLFRLPPFKPMLFLAQGFFHFPVSFFLGL